MNQLERTLTSLEVAEMVGREHSKVIRDIRTIISHLGTEAKSGSSKYFTESTYKDQTGRTLPCFLLSKKGCELYGTRMTGEKGTQFAVKYIERFNEMEQQQKVNFTMPQPTQAEIIAMIAQQGVEQERRLNDVEQRQLKLEQQQENIAEVVSLNVDGWKDKVSAILNRIAIARGGGDQFRKVRNESYEVLENRGKCRLNIRLENLKKEAQARGICSPSKIRNFNKITVIEADARLTEIYLAIVKEMAIAHKVNAEGLGA